MKLVKYPLPSVDDVIARVGDAKAFFKIDLECAYLQLPLDDDSKVLTTINTTKGLYQFIPLDDDSKVLTIQSIPLKDYTNLYL